MITVYNIISYNPDTKSCFKSINNYSVDENAYKTLNEVFTKTTDKEVTKTIILKMYYSELLGVPGIKIVCDKTKPEHMFFSANKNYTFFNIMNTIMSHFYFINEETDHYIYATRTYNKDTYSYDFEFSEMVR